MEPEVQNVDEQLEAIARDIDTTHALATWRIGERLAEARDLFRYKRDTGGFKGFVEGRLNMSEQQARRFINVYERVGANPNEFVQLSRQALFELTSPSTPEAVHDAVKELVVEGHKVTAKDIQLLRKQADALQTAVSELTGKNTKLETQISKTERLTNAFKERARKAAEEAAAKKLKKEIEAKDQKLTELEQLIESLQKPAETASANVVPFSPKHEAKIDDSPEPEVPGEDDEEDEGPIDASSSVEDRAHALYGSIMGLDRIPITPAEFWRVFGGQEHEAKRTMQEVSTALKILGAIHKGAPHAIR
jgi:hypothetical protein